MAMYNLIEYSNNYSKTSQCLWQYYRDEPVKMMVVLLLIILIMAIVTRLILKKKYMTKKAMMAQKMFK